MRPRYLVTGGSLAILAVSGLLLLLLAQEDPEPVVVSTARGEREDTDPIKGKKVLASDAGWTEHLRKAQRVRLVRDVNGVRKTVSVETLGKLPSSALQQHVEMSELVHRGVFGRLDAARSNGLAGVRLAKLEYDVIETRLYLEAMRWGTYQTFKSPGDAAKMWGGPTDRYSVLYSGIEIPSGQTVTVAVVLPFDRFPELLAARDALWDAWFVEASAAAEEFNGLSFEQRTHAVKELREDSKANSTNALKLLQVMRRHGGRYHRHRDDRVYPVHRSELTSGR